MKNRMNSRFSCPIKVPVKMQPNSIVQGKLGVESVTIFIIFNPKLTLKGISKFPVMNGMRVSKCLSG
jgi:hypothetical protein